VRSCLEAYSGTLPKVESIIEVIFIDLAAIMTMCE
jgi:hypothetical protein